MRQVILHPAISDIYERRQRIDKALRAGDLLATDGAFLTENYAFIYKDGPSPILGMGRSDSAEAGQADDSEYSIPFVITTLEEDRDGDVVVPAGYRGENYKRNPVWFFGHQQWEIPIGTSRSKDGRIAVYPEENRIRAICYFDSGDEDAMFIYGKVKRGIINATSIAFVPIEAYRREYEEKARTHNPQPLMPPGWLFKVWDHTETSVVGVPSNAGAIRDSLDREKSFISPRLQKGLRAYAATAKGCWNGWCPCPPCEEKAAGLVSKSIKPVVAAKATLMAESPPCERWNKSLGSIFNGDDIKVADPEAVGASTTYRIAAKYLGCQIKDLFQNATRVPSPRMGSFLTGLKHVLADYRLLEIRNIRDGEYKGDMESPPVHETIQLSSRQRDSFLVQGTAFYEGVLPRGKHPQARQILKGSGPHNAGRSNGERFVIRFEPTWNGLSVTVFTKTCAAALNQQVIDRAWNWAKQHNFLKGEAFALSGEFLSRSDEDWSDVFLEENNKKAVQRVLDLFNEKQLSFANRGVILTGPPGTGKTLSGRIIRNQAKGTFIWVSSRDFHASGSVGGVSLAFEMAKELAPAIIFMEDVDNWLHPTTVDLLKTEMDGISRSKGVLTILTTNFPEQLPDALIDRPGRFHDVLSFDLPTASARKAMLTKWLPMVQAATIDSAVTGTAGYSGAHVYELAKFAETLQEHDGLQPVKALEEALHKVEEQKELITRLQLEGSNYNPLRNQASTSTKYASKAIASKSVTKSHSCGCGNCKSGKACGCKSVRKAAPGALKVGDRVVVTQPGKDAGKEAVIIADGSDTTYSYYKVRFADGSTTNVTTNYVRKKSLKAAQPSSDISPEKACKILHDGEVNGHPLTEAQRRMFGAACSRKGKGRKDMAIHNVEKGRLVWADRAGDKEATAAGHKFTVYRPGRGGSTWILQVDGKNKIKGSLQVCLAAAEDELNKLEGSKSKGLSETSGAAGGYTVGESETESPGTTICTTCAGTGNCPDCAGKGEIDGIECSNCGGSGDCHACMGTGSVAKSIKGKPMASRKKTAKGGATLRKAKKDQVSDETATNEIPTEEDKDAVDEPFQPKPSAQVLANLYSHAKSEAEYLDKELLGMDHPGVKEDLEDYRDNNPGSPAKRMEHYKETLENHHPDHEMDELVKAIEGDTGTDENLEGEAGLVDEGEVPPDAEDKEAVDEPFDPEKEEGGDDDDALDEDHDTEEILERYRHPKSNCWMTRKVGTIRRTKDGVAYLVKGLKTKDLSDEGNPAEAKSSHYGMISKASEHMYSLSKAPDLPAHHEAGLVHHAGQLAKICKHLTHEGHREREGGPGSPLANEGNPTEAKSGKLVRLAPEVIQEFAALKRQFGQMTGLKLNGR